MAKLDLWIDSDMGNDDIMAIAMLSMNPAINLKCISLVDGVSRIPAGLLNLTSLLDYMQISLPVFIDRNRKMPTGNLQFPQIDIERAENLTLLENISFPKSETAAKHDLSGLLTQLGKSTTLLALGPLTNIAQLIHTYPELFKRKIDRIIMMGGGINKGNVGPLNVAEYNIALDPKSASIVFDSGIEIVMIGIDATSQVECRQNFTKQIRNFSPTNPKSKILREIIVNNQGDFNHFYDPLAAAWFFDETIFSGFLTGLISVTEMGAESGRTVFTQNSKSPVRIPMSVNDEKFYKLIKRLLTDSVNSSDYS